MFGHSDASYQMQNMIQNTAEKYYLEHNIRVFYVGNRGNFDRMAATAVKRLKKKYSDISLQLLLSYHPAERLVTLSEGFDGSFYPPLEGVPRRYAIVRANRYMACHTDAIICYVCHGGNTRNLLEYARHREIPIENIACIERNSCTTPENVL